MRVKDVESSRTKLKWKCVNNESQQDNLTSNMDERQQLRWGWFHMYVSQVAYIHGGASYCFPYCYFPDALTSLHAHPFAHFFQLKCKGNEQRANGRPISLKLQVAQCGVWAILKAKTVQCRVLALPLVLVLLLLLLLVICTSVYATNLLLLVLLDIFWGMHKCLYGLPLVQSQWAKVVQLLFCVLKSACEHPNHKFSLFQSVSRRCKTTEKTGTRSY